MPRSVSLVFNIPTPISIFFTVSTTVAPCQTSVELVQLVSAILLALRTKRCAQLGATLVNRQGETRFHHPDAKGTVHVQRVVPFVEGASTIRSRSMLVTGGASDHEGRGGGNNNVNSYGDVGVPGLTLLHKTRDIARGWQ